jgi:hypothetical protein
MGAQVHARGVEPDEERLAVLVRAVDEIPRCRPGFVVDRLHPLFRQRSGVLDLLAALAVGPAVQHSARAEVLPEVGEVLLGRIIPQFRLFLRVQMVEIAEELVESMHRRQVLVPVAEVVLAKLAGGIAMRLEQLGDRRVFGPHSQGCARHTDLAQSRAEHALAHDEGSAPRRAALLRVAIGEHHAFMGDAVDVGRLVAHHAPAVAAEVPVADIISPDDQNVGFSFWHLSSPSSFAIGC